MDPQREEGWSPLYGHNEGIQLLDLGAGDGGITQAFKGLFEEIYATEMSQVLLLESEIEGSSGDAIPSPTTRIPPG